MKRTLLAALLAVLATAAAAADPTTYVVAPRDGAVWGFDLDHPRPDGQALRVAYVMIDNEDPAIGDVRGDVLVDCPARSWRTLASGVYDPAGQPFAAATPVEAPTPLYGGLGDVLRAALCEGQPTPGPRYDLAKLHELARGQLR